MTKIQILGTGCPKCKKLAENAQAAVTAAGIECEIEKVTEINEIMKFGVIDDTGAGHRRPGKGRRQGPLVGRHHQDAHIVM